ncbi:MAG: hypothetical protein FD149_1771 [Rhodospirillaceae bacterium]|nr:MAG: hypothetical protein FD149_1771 [Rhodospirillaceae bacterium]
MTSRDLEAIIAKLERVDLSRFIRRQSTVHLLGNASKAEVAFQEFYISIADLQKVVAPKLDFATNRWLFQYLTTVLDRAVLRALTKMKLLVMPSAISLNLNVTSCRHPSFNAFLETLAEGQDVVVEMELVDAFAHLNDFLTIQAALHERGYKLLLDRLTPITFQLIDPTLFDAYYMKINWSPDLTDAVVPKDGETPQAFIARIGAEKFILARCDSEAAVKWGIAIGIRWFQGRFVDAMLAAVTMAGCLDSAACTLQQCTLRRGVIVGPHRDQCTNHRLLDTFPQIRSPGRG